MNSLTTRITLCRFVAAAVAFVFIHNFSLAQNPELPEGDPARTWKEDDSIDGRWNQADVGPFLASVLKLPGGDVAKCLSIKVGEKNEATVAYDTKTCSFRAAWTGGFLKFDPRRYGIVAAPAVDGKIVVESPARAWLDASTKLICLAQHGAVVTLSYDVDGVDVMETPGRTNHEHRIALSRLFVVSPHERPLRLLLSQGEGTPVETRSESGVVAAGFSTNKKLNCWALMPRNEAGGNVRLKFTGDTSRQLIVEIPASKDIQLFAVYHALSHDMANADLCDVVDHGKLAALDEDAARKPLWPNWIATGGKLGEGDGPYVIDTVHVPFDNPYKALMFTSGLGFLSNGDIAVCTLHGDVWLVRGVDDDLSDVKWKRFATGLCQPLGLTVVDDEIYVLGKDQITILHDTNGDDEADFYKCFNNDGATSLGGHDYAACLETDAAGNFYYIRAQEGVCKVSLDGKTHTSIAKGFRNPIGLGVGPDGMVTAAPQEGEWTPSSALIAVREGGYYGFGGPQKTDARPLGFDSPLCWMPRSQDNSSGGQVWVTSDKWGLPRGQMLHLSYGLCTALVVMHESVEDEHGAKAVQGGTVKLPLFFESGACRGRFSPRDGQLYICGLMGWQTAAAKDGCLQRVRYTGKPASVPVALHVKPHGVELTFNTPLDPESAGDPDNYFIEQWNYLYSANYGSQEYRPSDPKKFGRDEVYVDEVKLSSDNRTVYLQLEEVAPVMQMAITYQLKSAGGDEMKQTIYNTINAVPAK